ncbi:hypothetical protein BAUCODRAFT_325612 [Baudoinia panamericana UAMH 10762]|uniref:Xylose isomerase-like TIM barrel domain-containing protein n=1 Tax=Baudoinia panamericana (strain UAMH 10762) TaxID=717646 RepID=M2MJB0_BAUPA|nr:uncharacterized protein BAUCODRAFT_325612 [Baudoinia panamericana UAMH 10762]EMC91368.1 hypothetical protein BAUCODRAFT_325612 [Baudoinia panamericana UAMH 10762]
MEGLDKIPLSYATVSIGYKDDPNLKDAHTLPKKLDAIAAAGFTGIELGFPDLLSFANQHLRPAEQDSSAGTDEIDEYDYPNLCAAARVVKTMCDAKGLTVVMLQPFSNFEGWERGSEQRKNAWKRAEGWMEIMQAVGTDMLQIGSSDTPAEKIGKDRSRFVGELQELADVMAKKKMRIAYENWCWSTHAPDWEDVWDICKQVDRPNFGLCLDTFQSAGGEWADPSTESGMIEDGRSKDQVERDWKASCEKLSKTIPADKIFILQISDAYKPKPGPLAKDDIDGLRPRGFWSHAYRPLPFEGYLPVVDFAQAVLKTGYRDWFSYEIFDSGPDGKGKEYDLIEFAKTAMACQKKLADACAKAS